MLRPSANAAEGVGNQIVGVIISGGLEVSLCFQCSAQVWLVYAHLDERIGPRAVFSHLLMVLPQAISDFQCIRQRHGFESALSTNEDLATVDS